MRVKICCIGSLDEARLAIRYGANAVGLVSPMPSATGVIPNDLIRTIAEAVPPGVESFLLTSFTEPKAIIEHQRETGVTTVQLVDRVAPDDVAFVKDALPGISVVQVVHVTSDAVIDEAVSYSAVADALLLDSGTPESADRALGGTGRTHDWRISRRITQLVHCPVFLAGGLNPDNVQSAIREVGPFGVDVCSGLRPRGSLDERLLGSFMSAVGSCRPTGGCS